MIKLASKTNMELLGMEGRMKELEGLGKKTSRIEKEHIIRNNFDTHDLEDLVSNYINYNETVQLAIYDLCKRNIENITDSEIYLSRELFILLISDNLIHKEHKINLLSNVVEKISKEDFKKYVKISGCEEYLKVFFNKGRLPKVEKNNYNKQLLDKLKEKYWIYDYIQENNIYRIERMTKRRRDQLNEELL